MDVDAAFLEHDARECPGTWEVSHEHCVILGGVSTTAGCSTCGARHHAESDEETFAIARAAAYENSIEQLLQHLARPAGAADGPMHDVM